MEIFLISIPFYFGYFLFASTIWVTFSEGKGVRTKVRQAMREKGWR